MPIMNEISQEAQDGLGAVIRRLFDKIGDPFLDFLLKPIYKFGHIVSHQFDKRRQQKHYKFELANKLVHTFLKEHDIDMIIFSPHNGKKDLNGECFMFTSCKFHHINKCCKNEFMSYLINPDITMPYDDYQEWWQNCRDNMVEYEEHFDLDEKQFFKCYQKVQYTSFGLHYVFLLFKDKSGTMDAGLWEAITEQLSIFIKKTNFNK